MTASKKKPAKPNKSFRAKPAAKSKKAPKATPAATSTKPAPAGAPQGTASAAGHHPANLYALLMACDFYLPNQLPEGSYPNLAGCVRDVDHVEAFLRQRLGLTDDRLIKLTSTDVGAALPKESPDRRPTYENMVNAFKKLGQIAAKGDQVYIHYSGHGGRTPTILPKTKGAKALDEALVPVDIGKQSARYLRDIEIAKLLKSLVDKGLVVTVVFDCCHSGGAARAALRVETNMAVRGVSFVDTTARPTESLVGTIEELAAAWFATPSRTRDAAVASDFVSHAETLGYTLLAACRPSESAYEFAFQGAERNGALTYWLLQALQQLSPQLTFRMIYDQLLARIHSQFELQTPLLQGEPDRVVFGTCLVHPDFAAPVMSVAADGKSIRIAAGQANLVRAGAEFAVFPSATVDFSQTDKRAALVRVRTVGSVDATADVVQLFGKRKIQPGDEAVLLGAPSQKLVRKVRLERADGKPPAADDKALLAVRAALAGSGWVEPVVALGDTADFSVRAGDDGVFFEICDADSQPLPLRPMLKIADAAAPAQVAQRLVHLAKFRAVRELDNNDSNSPLKGKLVVKLLGIQEDFDPADKPDPKPFAAGMPPTLKPGQWTFLSIANKSSQVLNVAVLDLQPNWGISWISLGDGNSQFAPLDPDAEPLIVDLQASLPEGYSSGTDTLKVIGTVEPAGFRILELPPLDQRAAKAKGGKKASDFDGLLQALTENKPRSRDVSPSLAPSRGWVVSQVELRIEAAAGAAPARAAAEGHSEPARPSSHKAATRRSTKDLSEDFSTFRDRKLSLWQSAVEEVVAERTAAQTTGRGAKAAVSRDARAAIRQSDPVRAANALVAALAAGQPLTDPQPVLKVSARGVEDEAARGVVGAAWQCGKLALQLAWAKATGDSMTVQKLSNELAFSTCDPMWGQTIERYLMYFQKDMGSIPYRSGGDYVLDVALPEHASVALFADWGTGTQTAVTLLEQIARKKPDVVIHLGDIYYSGTQSEVQSRFLDVCRAVLGTTPLFTLAGNHDVYSGGIGYYWLVDQLSQRASYFCIRNKHWQFLAMDTGRNDFNPFTVQKNVTYLMDEEAAWHRAKIQEANANGRKTVLLSHHQLFSAFEPSGADPVNNKLLGTFQDYLGSISAWFWGHEHRLSIYDRFLGLERGRCIGCAAIPVFVETDFHTPKFNVPLLADPNHPSQPVMLGDDGALYNCAYAVMKLEGARARVSYYQHTDENNALFAESIAN